MLLIDHPLGILDFAKTVDHGEIEANTRALARTAVALGMPIDPPTSMEDALLWALAGNWASADGQKILQILGEEILSRG